MKGYWLSLFLVLSARCIFTVHGTCPGTGDVDFSLVVASCTDLSVLCVFSELILLGSSCAEIIEDFGGCNATITDVLYNGNFGACQSVMDNNTLCDSSFSSVINLACDGGEVCPGTDYLEQYAPIIDCVIFEPRSLSDKELREYDPYKCLAEYSDIDEDINGIPDVCQSDGDFFARLFYCEKTMSSVLEAIINETVGDSGLGNSCEELLPGSFLQGLCAKPIGEAMTEICDGRLFGLSTLVKSVMIALSLLLPLCVAFIFSTRSCYSLKQSIELEMYGEEKEMHESIGFWKQLKHSGTIQFGILVAIIDVVLDFVQYVEVSNKFSSVIPVRIQGCVVAFGFIGVGFFLFRMLWLNSVAKTMRIDSEYVRWRLSLVAVLTAGLEDVPQLFLTLYIVRTTEEVTTINVLMLGSSILSVVFSTLSPLLYHCGLL